jgi:hypothetical protein
MLKAPLTICHQLYAKRAWRAPWTYSPLRPVRRIWIRRPSPHDQYLRVATAHADRASNRSNRRIALAADLTRIVDRTRG